MIARFKDLCLDASDHQMLASWWCDVLGYERRVEPDWERGLAFICIDMRDK